MANRAFDPLKCVNSAFDVAHDGRPIFTPFGKFGKTYVVPEERQFALVMGVSRFCMVAAVLLIAFIAVGVWIRISHDPMRWTGLAVVLGLLTFWMLAFYTWVNMQCNHLTLGR